MRASFSWYFDGLNVDHDTNWNSAVVTVDANVLLDLYRYHNDTRDLILTALESFQDRIWISHQAATEFVRNRKGVIVEARNTIRKASSSVGDVKKALDKARSELQAHRVLPRNLIAEFDGSVNKAIELALTEIDNEANNYPDFLAQDDVLERILRMFDGRIGASPDDYEDAKKEAIRRIEKEVPPGYLDKKKEDDRAYGDYFVWRQVLHQSKDQQKPMIFVTSERKDDWWENKSGLTLGPRQELIREAADFTGQPITIYHLENFLRHHGNQTGARASDKAIDEVVALAEARADRPKKQNLFRKDQHVIHADEIENYGIIEVLLNRPTPHFTVTGHFEPSFDDVPLVNVELVEAPDEVGPMDCFVNTGTKYDFNIHSKSTDRGYFLPEGLYVFQYEASCNRQNAFD